ncbi:Tyrosine-protein kinase MasK [Bythopirellula polymerisocia]|uniref:Tyrosine-protein kinase MasK n=1 Tax=Bythopirellula polymerisocia TaxID=2528003 RepID=A0A5C6CKF6_9BACT|nr:Tyrosine-protein kinase MasK [Bythopirellula polymerisocia]
MMTEYDEPKLVDFGLARSMFMANVEDSAIQSMDGSVIGTPMFMSPEQARGENDKLDGRADIYAVGIILYVMLVRRHPHKVNHQDRWDTIRQIATGQARPPSEVKPNFDKQLEEIIMKALADQPVLRYQTAGALAKDLRKFLKQRVMEKREHAE